MKKINTHALSFFALLFLSFGISTHLQAQIPTKCFEIDNILIHACGGSEGYNEMLQFEVGPSPITVSNLVPTWPNNPFKGWKQNSGTAAVVAALNASIVRCGFIIEPVGGIIPSGKKVMIFMSPQVSVVANSFANLNDTIYAIFDSAGNSSGHFKNNGPVAAPYTRTTILKDNSTSCADTAVYYPDSLVGNPGEMATFTFAGKATYLPNNGCNAAYTIPTIKAGNDTTYSYCNKLDSIQVKAVTTGYFKFTKWHTTGLGIFTHSDSLKTYYHPTTGDVFPITFRIVGDLCGDSLSDTIVISRAIPSITTVNKTTCSGTSYVYNGHTYTLTGIYYDTLASVIGGCDSIVKTNLSISTVKTDIYDTICSNKSVLFNGITRTTAGIYLDTLVASNLCDSFIFYHLAFKPTVRDTIYDTLCNGNVIIFNGNVIGTAGYYNDTLMAKNGCDSFLTVKVTVLNVPKTILKDTICSNQSFFFKGQNRTTTNTYIDTLFGGAKSGCDSIVTLNLVVKPVARDTIYDTICINHPKLFNGNLLATTGTYYDTLTAVNSCDSFITLRLMVKDTSVKHLYDTICSNKSIVFNGITRTTAGTYRDTLINAVGCDSFIYYHLAFKPTVRDTIYDTLCNGNVIIFNGNVIGTAGYYNDTLMAKNGCDSFLTVKVTVLNVPKTILKDTICSNQSFFFKGQNRTTTNTYIDTLFGGAKSGCDSIVTLNLVVKPVARDTIYDTICSSQSILFNGINRSTPGYYLDTLSSVNTCDSFVTLALALRPAVYDTIYDTICHGSPYVFNGKNIISSGTYHDTLGATNTCDSFVTLKLYIRPNDSTTIYDTICVGKPYIFKGGNLTTTGTYRDTLKNIYTCDSFITLYLTVKNSSYFTKYDTICSGTPYQFNGKNLTSSGPYIDTLVATNGCDSFLTLQLTVNSPSSFTKYDTICSGTPYVFNGKNLTSSGPYLDTLVNANHCDSFLTLQLTVYNTSSFNVFDTICSGNSVNFKGQSLKATGQYKDTLKTIHGCDSFIIFNLYVRPVIITSISDTICTGKGGYNFHGKILTVANTYRDTLFGASATTCDSIVVLTLTVNNSVTNSIFASICQGKSYPFKGQNLTIANTYKDTLVGSNTCDSFVILTLMVTQPSSFSQTLTRCNGGVITIGTHTYSNTGIYTDTIPNQANCDSIITTNLTVIAAPTVVQSRLDSCFTAFVKGKHYNNSAALRDTVHSSSGCDSIIHIDSIIIHKPSITVTSSLQLPLSPGDSTQLIIHPVGTYYNVLWSPDSGISNIHRDSTMVAPTQNRTYTVAANDSATNCRVTASIDITVIIPKDSFYAMPTAFSPNGDAVNQRFRAVTKPNTDVLAFRIYNRWGQLVYDYTVDDQSGWDGTIGGTPQPISVYSYYIQLRYNPTNQISQQVGNVTLVR